MKTFDGSVEKNIFVSGKVQKAEPDFKAEVKPKPEITEAKIKKENVFSGITVFALNAISGVVKVLTALYRFIVSHSVIKQTHRAKATAAPAMELDSDSKITVELDAPLTAQPAADLKTEIELKSSLSANLATRRLSILRYIKGMLFNPIAKLKTALGSVAKYEKKIPQAVKIQATTAQAVEVESRFNTIKQTHEVTANSAPAQIAGMETSFTATHSASANAVGAISADLDSAVKVTHSAPLYAWFLTEREDENTLYIPQVFSGVQSGTMIEIDLETDATYWANAFNNGGVLYLVFAETAIQTNNNLEVS